GIGDTAGGTGRGRVQPREVTVVAIPVDPAVCRVLLGLGNFLFMALLGDALLQRGTAHFHGGTSTVSKGQVIERLESVRKDALVGVTVVGQGIVVGQQRRGAGGQAAGTHARLGIGIVVTDKDIGKAAAAGVMLARQLLDARLFLQVQQAVIALRPLFQQRQRRGRLALAYVRLPALGLARVGRENRGTGTALQQ